MEVCIVAMQILLVNFQDWELIAYDIKNRQKSIEKEVEEKK